MRLCLCYDTIDLLYVHAGVHENNRGEQQVVQGGNACSRLAAAALRGLLVWQPDRSINNVAHRQGCVHMHARIGPVYVTHAARPLPKPPVEDRIMDSGDNTVSKCTRAPTTYTILFLGSAAAGPGNLSSHRKEATSGNWAFSIPGHWVDVRRSSDSRFHICGERLCFFFNKLGSI